MRQIVTYLLSSLLFVWIGTQQGYAQHLAVKTNGLSLLAGVPNLGFEMVVGERSSLDVSAYGGYHPYGNDVRIVGIQPEYRYWFNGRPMVREYIGIALLAANYDLHWRKHIYDGDAVGAGITMGYSFPIGRRLNIECSAGFGIIRFWHQQYYKYDNFADYETNNQGKTNARGYKLFPAKLAVSISYVIW